MVETPKHSHNGVRRLLIVTSRFAQGHGGAPEALLLLANFMGGFGVTTDVLSRTGLSRSIEHLASLPEETVDGQPGSGAIRLEAYSGLMIVGAWNTHALRLLPDALRRGLPIIYSPKGGLCRAEFGRTSSLKLAYLVLVESLIVLLCRHCLLSSQAERRNLVIPWPLIGRKVAILPEPFFGPPLQAAEPIAARDVFVVGFLAEISPRKGLDRLIAGLAAFCASRPEIKVTLRIGGKFRRGQAAYRKAVEEAARAVPAGLAIEWLGPVSAEARQRFYEGLDLFACPSRFESFGLTPLEALWFGCPCMVAPDVGVLEFVDIEEGCLVRLPSLDTDAISAAIAAVAADRADLRRRASRWRAHRFPALDGPQVASRLMSLFGWAAPPEPGWR